MRLDKRLNIVIPVYDDDGKTLIAHVHSTPLPAEMVDANFLILAQTFSAVFNQGLGKAAGPGVAMRLLRQIADNTETWTNKDGTPGPAQILVDEIRRLTTVIAHAPDKKSWQQIPLQVAVDRGILNSDDKSEVENAIAFFIAVSATLPRAQRREMLEDVAGLWGARITPLNCTEWIASLKMSIGTANTGEKPPAPAPGPSDVANATLDGKPVSVPR